MPGSTTNHVLVVDTAFTKTQHEYVLFLATGLDANQEGTNIAWGIAPKENHDHWGWFLSNLDIALPGLNSKGTVIMSDCQKGLTWAIETTLPLVTEAYCAKHSERNLVEGLETRLARFTGR